MIYVCSNTLPTRGMDMLGENDKTCPFVIDPVVAKTPLPSGISNPIPFGPPSQIGDLGTFGHFRMIRLIGKGSAGAVYHAFDSEKKSDAAIKILIPGAGGKRSRERFVREAKACAKVQNDHVVAIRRTGETNGLPFIEMEYLRGLPLDQYLKKTPRVRFTQLLRFSREVATGLAAIHEAGIIHRDIKPANIWLEAPNGKAKLLDFGLVHTDDPQAEALTQHGTVVGTPAYMSPEQARGRTIDHRTDLYSLGIVIYQMATGQIPFQGKSALDVVTAIVTETPKPISHINTSIPKSFSDFVQKLLAKDAAKRPANAQEVIDFLRTVPAASLTPNPDLIFSNEVRSELASFETLNSNTWATLSDVKPRPLKKQKYRKAKQINPKWYWIAAAISAVIVIGILVFLKLR